MLENMRALLILILNQELLTAGADPNTVDDEGETVLHRAVAKRHTECAMVILEVGGCESMGVVNAKQLTYVFLIVFSPSVGAEGLTYWLVSHL